MNERDTLTPPPPMPTLEPVTPHPHPPGRAAAAAMTQRFTITAAPSNPAHITLIPETRRDGQWVTEHDAPALSLSPGASTTLQVWGHRRYILADLSYVLDELTS